MRFSTVKDWLRGLLHRSQGITGTDNVYIAKGGFWTTLQFVAGAVASIGTVIAFGNLLPRETYGIYKYLLSLAGTFGFLTLTGMNVAVMRAVAREQAGVLPYAVGLQIKYNLLATIAIGGLAAYYGFLGNMVFAASLTVLAIALPLTSAYNTYSAALSGKKRFDLLAIITALSSFAAAIAIIVALFLTDNVVLLIATYAAATLVPNVLAYVYVRRLLIPTPPSPETIAELRKTGFHLTFVGLIGTVAQYLDKLVLFQAAGPLALAVYGFAIAGPERLTGFAKNWIGIILPRLATRDIRQIRSVFYQRIAITLLVGAALAGLYWLLAPILFKWFLPQYLDAIPYSRIYILGPTFGLAAVYIGNVFQGQNMLRAIYVYSIGSQSTRIILLLAMGWRWEIWGIILATVIARVLATFFAVVVWEVESRRLLRLQPLP